MSSAQRHKVATQLAEAMSGNPMYQSVVEKFGFDAVVDELTSRMGNRQRLQPSEIETFLTNTLPRRGDNMVNDALRISHSRGGRRAPARRLGQTPSWFAP